LLACSVTDSHGNCGPSLLQRNHLPAAVFLGPEPARSLYREGGWDLESLDRIASKDLIGGVINEFLPR
jgi:hypothetical protein